MSTSVASVVSHFPSAENGFTTTTSGSVSSGATTVGLNSVAGYANGEIAVFVIDPSNASKQTFTGTIDTSGVQVTDVVWTAGSNTTHAVGATVVDYATATHISMMTKGLLVEHNQDGTHSSVTADDIVIADGGTLDVDTINEATSANGVTIDGLNIKDGALTTADSVDSTNIDFGGSGAGVWWEEIGRTTLGSAGDTISVTPIAARKWLAFKIAVQGTGGTISVAIRFNNDSGSNYAYMSSTNGGADSTTTSATSISLTSAVTYANFECSGFCTNIAAKEKLPELHRLIPNTAGAGTAPSSAFFVGKWANTSDQITRIDVLNLSGTGDFAIGSEVVVLGHD